MRAVVYHGQGDVRVECLPLPACEEGGLLVKVEACAVCGSDMKAYRSGNPRMRPPVTMGHEFVGAVVENRAGLAFAVGDSVVMATSVACGTCTYCARGWRNLCAAVRPMGFSFPGGMADYVAIPALAVRGGHVVKVPVSLNPFHAALAEPVSCAVNGCENGAVRQGDTVLVMGAGPMGILNAVVARRFGATRVILSEINPARLKQAEAFGVDRLVDPSRESLPDVVRDATQGLGADVVIGIDVGKSPNLAPRWLTPQGQACGLSGRMVCGNCTRIIQSLYWRKSWIAAVYCSSALSRWPIW